LLGPWTSPGIEILGTFHSSLQKNQSIAPDLQLMALPLGVSNDNGFILKKAIGISDEVYIPHICSINIIDKQYVCINNMYGPN
jgi:hypothetical protein